MALPLTIVDRTLPFLPWTLLIYFSDYFFILLILLSLKKAEEFSRAFASMIIGIAISFRIFLAFPTVYPRPGLPFDPFWSDVFLYLHFLDQPTNCFPSLHVSMTLIAAASMPAWPTRIRLTAWIWAIAICFSTLTTKQHYVWDVIGGVAVAVASVWISRALCAAKAP